MYTVIFYTVQHLYISKFKRHNIFTAEKAMLSLEFHYQSLCEVCRAYCIPKLKIQLIRPPIFALQTIVVYTVDRY
jgi:hypothetical protein